MIDDQGLSMDIPDGHTSQWGLSGFLGTGECQFKKVSSVCVLLFSHLNMC